MLAFQVPSIWITHFGFLSIFEYRYPRPLTSFLVVLHQNNAKTIRNQNKTKRTVQNVSWPFPTRYEYKKREEIEKWMFISGNTFPSSITKWSIYVECECSSLLFLQSFFFFLSLSFNTSFLICICHAYGYGLWPPLC